MLRGTPPMTLAVQYHRLSTSPICRGKGAVRGGELVWRYQTSPTPFSRSYSVRIEYQKGDVPRVFVEEPDLLQLSGGRRLPHVYKQQPPRLCLYLPGAGEWRPTMGLDQTIVPWTMLWLLYFEEWLDSNEWKGGGVHPGEGTKDDGS